MRRIKIDKSFDDNVNLFCDNLFSKRKASFELPLVRLQNLFAKKHKIFNCNERKYIQHIIKNYDKIIRIKPNEIPSLISEFDKIIKHDKIRENFHKEITFALRYEDLRDKEYLEFIKDLQIKSCVYCNANFALVIDAEINKKGIVKSRKGNFELDHFYPKSKYPFLSTSFYNLFPCCSNCNKSKSAEPSLFELYTTNNDCDIFEFVLDNKSIIEYWNTRDISKIKFEFKAIKSADNNILINHTELFKIQEIYETQKDVVEELFHFAEVYNHIYKSNLVNNFQSLFPDVAMINRLIIGTYDKPDEIHKRPLSKFRQDIAKNLKII